MKVAFPVRLDATQKAGGDIAQLQEYIEQGKRLHLFSGNLVTDPTASLESYDLIHLSNIDRPVDCYLYLRKANIFGKPVVISPIHHSYADIEEYEKKGRYGLARFISGRLGFRRMELIRSVFRSRRHPELIFPTLICAIRGVASVQRSIFEKSRAIYVLSNREAELITRDFGIATDATFELVRNGGDNVPNIRSLEEERSGIVVVGRIEARKNQIAIMEAAESLSMTVTFIGPLNAGHASYCNKFIDRVERGGHRHLGARSSTEVRSLMRNASIHVSASWFEVSSLVDIEAYGCGCKVVSSTRGATSEILGSRADYCNPASVSDIADAIMRATLRLGDEGDRLIVPTWADAATELSQSYQRVLGDANHPKMHIPI